MVGCGVDSENNSNDDLIYKARIENEDKSTQIRINVFKERYKGYLFSEIVL